MTKLSQTEQLSLATQMLLIGVETIFESTPGLEFFILSYNPQTQDFQIHSIQHPDVDPDYGTPQHLVNYLKSKLHFLRETIPFIDDFFLQKNLTWAGNRDFYSYCFRHPEQMAYDFHLSNCLGVPFSELVQIRETQRLLQVLPNKQCSTHLKTRL